MDIMISCYFTLKFEQRTPNGETLSFILVVFSLFVVFLFMPINFFVIYRNTKEDFESEDNNALADVFSSIID